MIKICLLIVYAINVLLTYIELTGNCQILSQIE